MKFIIDNITLPPQKEKPDFHTILLEQFPGISLTFIRILRRSLDARKKHAIVFRYRLLVETSDENAPFLLRFSNVSRYEENTQIAILKKKLPQRPLIVGAGPAGLFAALYCAEAGVECDIIERGKPIDERFSDIRMLERHGTLNPESNVVFGEGGAGTYSDGKLTTRTHREEVRWFFKKLVEYGAPEEIMFEAKPHIGTDQLSGIIKSIRSHLESCGCVFRFQTKMEDIEIIKGRIAGIRTADGTMVKRNIVILATGHSARDVYTMLQKKNVALQKKGFAVGMRVEHPREMIDEIQFGKEGIKAGLASAEYFLVWNNPKTHRGVYSFCMCPGGSIINSSSEYNRLCTNGMSHSMRNSKFSNAAIVVSIHADDLGDDALDGIAFQRMLEEKAYVQGGGGFVAPAQRITSFLHRTIDTSLPEISFMPGCIAGRLDMLVPEQLRIEIAAALPFFNQKMPGFLSTEGVLVGVETRTSSPVRILRGDDFQSQSFKGLYPAGEGAGYAGGIVSSAVDGIRVAHAILGLRKS